MNRTGVKGRGGKGVVSVSAGLKVCLLLAAGCLSVKVVSAHAPVVPPDGSRAADADAVALMKKVTDRLRSIKTMTSEVSTKRWTLDAQGNPTGKADEDSGTVQMARPNQMRVKRGSFQILCDGSSLWMIQDDARRGTKSPLRWMPPVSGAMPPFFATDLPLEAQEINAPVRLAGESKIDGEKYQVLEAVGKAGLKRWFVGTDHLIHRAESITYLPPGLREKQEVVYRNLKTNVAIDDKAFRFDPPKGFQLVTYGPNFDADDMRLQPGMQAPDLTLPTADGKTFRLADAWNGKKLTLMYIWNVHCGACHHTLPVLEALRKQYGDQGLNVVAIHEGNADYEAIRSEDSKYRGESGQERRTRDALQRYASDYDFQFTQAMVLTADSFRAYECGSYPSVYFIDGKGKIVARSHAHNPKFFREVMVKSGLVSESGAPIKP